MSTIDRYAVLSRDAAANIDRLTAQVAELKNERDAAHALHGAIYDANISLHGQVRALQEQLTACEQERNHFKYVADWRKDSLDIVDSEIERLKASIALTDKNTRTMMNELHQLRDFKVMAEAQHEDDNGMLNTAWQRAQEAETRVAVLEAALQEAKLVRPMFTALRLGWDEIIQHNARIDAALTPPTPDKPAETQAATCKHAWKYDDGQCDDCGEFTEATGSPTSAGAPDLFKECPDCGYQTGDEKYVEGLRADLAAEKKAREEAEAACAAMRSEYEYMLTDVIENERHTFHARAVAALKNDAGRAFLERLRSAEAERDQRVSEALELIGVLEKEREAHAATRSERDAYRKAKQENDERFMTERDEARAALDKVRRDRDTMIAVHDEVEKERDALRAALERSVATLREARDGIAGIYRHIDEDREIKAMKACKPITDKIDAILADPTCKAAGEAWRELEAENKQLNATVAEVEFAAYTGELDCLREMLTTNEHAWKTVEKDLRAILEITRETWTGDNVTVESLASEALAAVDARKVKP